MLVLPEEVKPDAARAASRVTGALVVTMPKAFRKPKRGEEKKDEYVVDGNGDVEGSKGRVGGGRTLGKRRRREEWAASGTGSDTFDRRLGGVSGGGIVRGRAAGERTSAGSPSRSRQRPPRRRPRRPARGAECSAPTTTSPRRSDGGVRVVPS